MLPSGKLSLFFGFILAIFAISLIQISDQTVCPSGENATTFQQLLVGSVSVHVYVNRSVASVKACATECVKETPTCFGFNYAESTGDCRLVNQRLNIPDAVADPTFYYVEKV